MKANRRSAPIRIFALTTLAALVASCSSTRVIPPPQPAPTPAPRPAPPPPPPPPPQTGLDWRDMPISPGDWAWSVEAGQSVARFGGDALVLRCDRAGGTIVLQRAGGPAAGAGPEPLTVTTTSGVRTLSAIPQPGPVPALAVALPAGDRVVDAMAFSRGRFVIEAPGLAPLYVPSWPEVSRIAEDCR